MTYANDPDILLRGIPLSPQDERAIHLIRGSDRCVVRSNEVRISFEEYPADALRIWFPELVVAMREHWFDETNCDQLVELRADMQRRLRTIRADRGIHVGPKWILSDRVSELRPAVRTRLWCGEPQISVRALILALGRFNIASPHVVRHLEDRWRVFRRERELDMYGALTPKV
jgi:hypothetical protein